MAVPSITGALGLDLTTWFEMIFVLIAIFIIVKHGNEVANLVSASGRSLNSTITALQGGSAA